MQNIDLTSVARFGQPSETVKLDVFVVSSARPPTTFWKTATPSPSAPCVGSRDLRERMANGMTRVIGKRSPKRRFSNDVCSGAEACSGWASWRRACHLRRQEAGHDSDGFLADRKDGAEIGLSLG